MELMLMFTAGTYKPIVHTRRRTVLHIAISSSKEWMQKAVRHVKSRKPILFFGEVQDKSENGSSPGESLRGGREELHV